MNISIIMMYARRIYTEISIIHVISHRLYKRRVFLVAGYLLIYNSGNQDIRSISIPINLILLIVLVIRNLGGIFIFTITTEHLFKTLIIPINILVIPIMLLSLFFIVKITIKLLEIASNRGKSSALSIKLNNKYYSLILPILLCIFGELYLGKMQQIVFYEQPFNNILFLLLIFIIPMQAIHKSEIDDIRPIRLDQDINIEVYINIIKRFTYIRIHILIL